jgi:hypothetical protein
MVGFSTGARQGLPSGHLCVQARTMPPLLLVLILLLAGCVPGRATSGGVPTADAPFTLVALAVGQPTFLFRGQNAPNPAVPAAAAFSLTS